MIPDQIKGIAGLKQSDEVKRVQILYIVSVVEMALAILTEESVFFKSLHSVILGAMEVCVMIRQAFDSNKYLKLQSEKILERINLFKGKPKIPDSIC